MRSRRPPHARRALRMRKVLDPKSTPARAPSGEATTRVLNPGMAARAVQVKAVRLVGTTRHAGTESLLANDLGNGLFLLTGGFDVAVKGRRCLLHSDRLPAVRRARWHA